MIFRTGSFIPAVFAAALLATGSAWAQKPGGVLKIQHMDTPPSASIHEEATVSVAVPFMGLYNNLVLFDQHVPKNSLDSIVPELATKWEWSTDGKQLVFTLRQGVKWHDGKPFTAKDVACTFELLLSGESKLRRNPRGAWYTNVDKVTADGDFTATFHLKERQPALLALLASGYTPVYPCHVSGADMRRRPIGTGPYKLAEFKMNESIKLVKNPDYWKPGRPYLDGIEYTIISDRSTRMLSFASGKFDMTFPTDLTVPLWKNMMKDAPHVKCTMRDTGVSTNLIVNREVPPFDDPKIRRALALTLDRKAFIDILSEGEASIAAQSASGQYGKMRACEAIVGWADLMLGSRVRAVLEAEMAVAGGRFRGVRYGTSWDEGPAGEHVSRPIPRHRLLDPKFREGFAELGKLGLTFDSWHFFPQLPDLLDIARAFPDQTIIVDHVGGHLGVGQYAGKQAETLPVWRKNMQDLAGCPNVVVKLGGLGMTSFGFGFEFREMPPSSQELAVAWKPFIETCIDLFGSNRCMFESNFPPDKHRAATPSCGTPSSSSPRARRPPRRRTSTAAPPRARTR